MAPGGGEGCRKGQVSWKKHGSVQKARRGKQPGQVLTGLKIEPPSCLKTGWLCAQCARVVGDLGLLLSPLLDKKGSANIASLAFRVGRLGGNYCEPNFECHTIKEN